LVARDDVSRPFSPPGTRDSMITAPRSISDPYCGEDNIGIGNRLHPGPPPGRRLFEHLCHDKGYGWRGDRSLWDAVVTPGESALLGEFPIDRRNGKGALAEATIAR